MSTNLSKNGIAELQTSLAGVEAKVMNHNAAILKAIADGQIASLGTAKEVFRRDYELRAGNRVLHYLTDRGTIRNASAGKLRLYKGILSKLSEMSLIPRLIREIIADVYKKEMSDLFPEDHEFALVNPNQRAVHGTVNYSVIVEATPATIRYAKRLGEKGKHKSFSAYLIMPTVVPEASFTDANLRAAMLSKQRSMRPVDKADMEKVGVEFFEDISSRMMACMKLVGDELWGNKNKAHLAYYDSFITEVQKKFALPTFVDRNMNLQQLCNKYPTITPSRMVHIAGVLFGSLMSMIEEYLKVSTLPKRDKDDYLAKRGTFFKLLSGEERYKIGIKIISYTDGEAIAAHEKSSTVVEVIAREALPDVPRRNLGQETEVVTGINFLQYMTKIPKRSRGNLPMAENRVMENYLRQPTPGEEPHHPAFTFRGDIHLARHSKAVADLLDGNIRIFRTLMRKNIWLNP